MTAVSPRPLIGRWLAVGALVLAVAAIAFGIGTAYAADPRLAEADAALQKAAALLEASQSGVDSPKTQKEFDKAVGNALADVASARAEILAAQNAVDNP
jgi:hypothetical protein